MYHCRSRKSIVVFCYKRLTKRHLEIDGIWTMGASVFLSKLHALLLGWKGKLLRLAVIGRHCCRFQSIALLPSLFHFFLHHLLGEASCNILDLAFSLSSLFVDFLMNGAALVQKAFHVPLAPEFQTAFQEGTVLFWI